MQALFILRYDPNVLYPKPGRNDDLYLRVLSKLLGLTSLLSYAEVKEFVNALYESSSHGPDASTPTHFFVAF